MIAAPSSSQRVSRKDFLNTIHAVGGLALVGWTPGGAARVSRLSCPHVEGKNIRWIVPFTPGGGYDIYSRLIEPFYEERLGAEIVIDNVPGAAGVVAARTLRSAKPNGLTLGIQNASGLLVAAMTGQTPSLNPATDFTILGRVSPVQMVWTTGTRSPFKTIEDVFRRSDDRPIVLGITEVASSSFVTAAVVAHLLHVNHEYVAGFAGSREASLAAVSGNVDIACYPLESIQDRIEAGDLRPLLQVEANPIAFHESLRGVPALEGKEGLAIQRARALGLDAEEAAAMVTALTAVNNAGRTIVAPPGLPPDLFQCLDQHLHEVLTDPAFEAAAATASRSLDVATADVAREQMVAAARSVDTLLPTVRAAIQKVRG